MNSVAGGPPELRQRAQERLRIGRELHDALGGDLLNLALQPTVDLQTGRIIGADALLRAPRASGDLMRADSFLSSAARAGVPIGPVGRWILTNACAEVQAIKRQLGRSAPLGVSLNISGAQLRAEGIVDDVSTALRVSGLPPADLCLEITERAFTQGLPAALATIDALHTIGVRCALDGCRTGYASMLFIQHFRIDVVKLDPEFVGDVARHASQREMVRAVIAIAHGLGATVVVEDVGSAELSEALSELSCDAAEGPYFAPPLSLVDFTSLCGREQHQWDRVA